MVFYLFFSYTAFTSGGKAKWKIHQQHANFCFKFLRIIHQIAFVLQVRFHIVLLSVTRIYHPRRLFIAKGNLVEFSCAEYFLPFEECRIRGVTVHWYIFTGYICHCVDPSHAFENLVWVLCKYQNKKSRSKLVSSENLGFNTELSH